MDYAFIIQSREWFARPGCGLFLFRFNDHSFCGSCLRKNFIAINQLESTYTFDICY